MSKEILPITLFEKEVFEYLNLVRESGAINMFAAPQEVQEEFSVDRDESRDLVKKWMRVFNVDGYDHLPIVEAEQNQTL